MLNCKKVRPERQAVGRPCRGGCACRLSLSWSCDRSDVAVSKVTVPTSTLSTTVPDQTHFSKYVYISVLFFYAIRVCLMCVRAHECFPSSRTGKEDQPTSSFKSKMSHRSMLIKKSLRGKHWSAPSIKTKCLMSCVCSVQR